MVSLTHLDSICSQIQFLLLLEGRSGSYGVDQTLASILFFQGPFPGEGNKGCLSCLGLHIKAELSREFPLGHPQTLCCSFLVGTPQASSGKTLAAPESAGLPPSTPALHASLLHMRRSVAELRLQLQQMRQLQVQPLSHSYMSFVSARLGSAPCDTFSQFFNI